MNFSFITLFPEIILSYFSYGVLGRAVKSKLINVQVYNLRDYSFDDSKTVDDYPYGGGPGMLLKPEPIGLAIQHVCSVVRGKVILLSSTGIPFSSSLAHKLSKEKALIFVCGRYEGVDARISEIFSDYEISIGQFVLTGGEIAALAVADAISRFIPGVLGNLSSSELESYNDIINLEAPHYTRPSMYYGLSVPKVLTSGNHKLVAEYKRVKSEELRSKRVSYLNKT